MPILTRAIYREETYTFPRATGIYFKSNFLDLTPRVSALPGLDGGLDEYAGARPPAAIGNVTYRFFLHPPDNMTQQESAAWIDNELFNLARLSDWGRFRLYASFERDNTDYFCFAIANNISVPQNSQNNAEYLLGVTMNFQVPNPKWLTLGGVAPTYGTGFLYGSGVTYGGGAQSNNISGLQTDVELEYLGNSTASAQVILQTGTGQTIVTPQVQRLIGSDPIQSFTWNDTIAQDRLLEVNARAYRVQYDGSNSYDNFTYTNVPWLSLAPGMNTIRVNTGSAASAGIISVRVFQEFRR